MTERTHSIAYSCAQFRGGVGMHLGGVLQPWSTAPARRVGARAARGPETQPGPAGLLGTYALLCPHFLVKGKRLHSARMTFPEFQKVSSNK